MYGTLEVHINSTLDWSDHCLITVAKATKCLNFTCHSLWGSVTKPVTYNKCIVQPVLEYAAQVWNPHTVKNINWSIDELPAGILFLGGGLNHLMNVFPVYIGLPLQFVEITSYSMIFCITDTPPYNLILFTT